MEQSERGTPTFFPDYYFQKAHRLGLGTTCMKNDSLNYHTHYTKASRSNRSIQRLAGTSGGRGLGIGEGPQIFRAILYFF